MESGVATRATTRTAKKGRIDFPILLVTILLCGFGLLMLFSASYYYAQSSANTNNDGLFYVKKQALGILLGFAALVLIMHVDYHKLERLKTPALIVSLILLVLVLFLGVEKNGAKRWLVIGGQSIQPAEIAKVSMMLYMCAFMSRKQELMRSFTRGVVPMLIIIGVVCVPILLQPNFSTVLSVAILGFALLLVGGADVKQMLLIAAVGVLAMWLLARMEEYRMARLTIFTDPWKDASGDGYQLIQSLYALGSGGLFGQGLNASRQKLLFLPYSESDFIFSIIGEELGFVGALLLLLAYAFLIYRGIRVALRCKDIFGSMLATGITLIFALQVLINVAVVTSSIPPTGVTLPFISAGNSSFLIFLSSIGILLNISRSTTNPP